MGNSDDERPTEAPQTAQPSPRPGEHLERLVDDLEKKVEKDREDEGAEGNVADRERQPVVDTGDEAPD